MLHPVTSLTGVEMSRAAQPRKTTQARGAISELRACADLMAAGYYVYRCESSAAPFDLVAYKDGQILRVEVKSVSWNLDRRDEERVVALHPNFTWPKNTEWDLLAVVGDDQVFYFDSSTTREEARNHVREHYGFAPGQYGPYKRR